VRSPQFRGRRQEIGAPVNKQELRCLLERLGVRPSRRLGQHFLVDRNLLDAFVRDAAPRPDEHILEVGPGPGVLTERLLDAGAVVIAVEIDSRFVGYLRERFRDRTKLRVLHADACRIDYDDLWGASPWRSVSNLPYAITGPLLAKFATLSNPPLRLHLLLQREAAERILATPDTPEYGTPAVLAAQCWSGGLLRDVPPDVFYPRPEVHSAWVRLEARPDMPSAAERRAVETVARTAFSQRRKRAAKVLAKRFGTAAVDAAFAQLGLPSDARAEDLSPGDYRSLASVLIPADED